jgi:hypothetical protein
MTRLSKLFEALHVSLELSTLEEVVRACKLIMEVECMGSASRDVLQATYTHGPLFDGDLPSKLGRDKLVELGYVVRVVVKGEEGLNACTYTGADAYRLIKAGA